MAQIIKAQEDERQRIAQDLHDGTYYIKISGDKNTVNDEEETMLNQQTIMSFSMVPLELANRLACALDNSAARAGYTVLYVRAARLFETPQQSQGDGSHLKTLR